MDKDKLQIVEIREVRECDFCLVMIIMNVFYSVGNWDFLGGRFHYGFF